MIILVCGERDEGKTSSLKAWYQAGELVEGTVGFLSHKVFEPKFVGYDLVSLDDQVTYPFMRFADHPLCQSFRDQEAIGPFILDHQVLEEVQTYLLEAVDKGAKALCLDEIGRLELRGGGYDFMLPSLLALDVDHYWVVRTPFAREICQKYNLSPVKIKKV